MKEKLKKHLSLFNSLNERKMKEIKGSGTCGCGCCYEDQPGGSSTHSNGSANCEGNLWSDCKIRRIYVC